MTECGNDATQRVERNEAAMSHRVLDIVRENPQIEHVSDEMHPPPMEKHAADKAQWCWDDGVFRCNGIRAKDNGRNGPELIYEYAFCRAGK